MTTKATVTIAVGERTFEVPIEDVRSLGDVSNAVASEFEALYDGHGNLLDPKDKALAGDLASVMRATREAWHLH